MQSIDLLMSYQPTQMYLTHFNRLSDPASLVDQHHEWIDKFVGLAEEIQPKDDDGLTKMKRGMGEMLQESFDLSDEIISGQLAMDIDLNSKGLVYWYQTRDVN